MARTSDRVVIAYVHPTDVTIGFHHSLVLLLTRDMNKDRRVANVRGKYSSANISNARNTLVKEFLAEDDAEWLLFVDTDMIFEANSLDRLLKSAHEKLSPVVGALCYGVDSKKLFPTLYAVAQGEDGKPVVVRFSTFPETIKFKVDATGTAFLLIHRSVLEAVRDREFNDTYQWFQETSLAGQPVGEDVTFCFRVGLCGFPVHVDPSVRIGHQKTYVADHALYAKQQLEERRVPETPPTPIALDISAEAEVVPAAAVSEEETP